MIFRLFLTIPTLYILSTGNISFIKENILIILPLILSILDFADNILTFSNRCAQTFDYQYKDKILDIFSYFYTYSIFPLNSGILYFTIFRAVGILLFSLTRDKYWLILFFDFVKEYMLYLYLFKDNLKFLPLAIGGKIIFEYFFHTMINKEAHSETT